MKVFEGNSCKNSALEWYLKAFEGSSCRNGLPDRVKAMKTAILAETCCKKYSFEVELVSKAVKTAILAERCCKKYSFEVELVSPVAHKTPT